MPKKKCIVMFSGGLDSRLVIKIIQEQNFEILALFFKLPFGTGCCNENCAFNFSQLQRVELKIIDCTKSELLQEYLNVIKKPKYKRGSGINPCVDCRIFMFKKAKEFADDKKIELIVSGEVLGERPMSQMKKAMEIIEKESGLQGRLLRPLSAKLLPETNAEKKGLIDRKKLYSIRGRKREKQIALAKKFKINYPSPAGGCMLCEKALAKRFKTLINKNLDESTIKLLEIGRHFIINDCWIVLGRNEKENKIIETLGKKYELIVPEFPGPSAVILSLSKQEASPKVSSLRSETKNPINNKSKKINQREVKNFLQRVEGWEKVSKQEKLTNKVNELIKAYSKKGNLKDRKKFEKYKL